MNDSLSVWRRARARWSVLGVCFVLIAPRSVMAQAPDPTPAPSEPKANPPVAAEDDMDSESDAES